MRGMGALVCVRIPQCRRQRGVTPGLGEQSIPTIREEMVRVPFCPLGVVHAGEGIAFKSGVRRAGRREALRDFKAASL